MTTTHRELHRLLSYKVFAHSELSKTAVLELKTKDEEFLCLVSQEDLRQLSTAFHKSAQSMDD
jgi:hypothetical protein